MGADQGGGSELAAQEPAFPEAFDSRFTFGPDSRLTGQFGTDVLAGLIKGIDEFSSDVAGRRLGRARRDGPAMLGAFMWLDDPQFMERIAGYHRACVAFSSKNSATTSPSSPPPDHPAGNPAPLTLRRALPRAGNSPIFGLAVGQRSTRGGAGQAISGPRGANAGSTQ